MIKFIKTIFALAASCYTTAQAYNAKDGLALAKLEQAVYCGKARFNGWDVGEQLYSINKSMVRYIRNPKTMCTAGVGRMISPDGCFVAVQGTVGPIQSILDGFFWTKKFNRSSCSNCWVHAGWWDSYESIKIDLFNALQEFGCTGKDLHITGHSLGAAAATYFLYDVLDQNWTVAHMTAMESPRPGDIGFEAALQAMLKHSAVDAVRITHHQDIVVHLPPVFSYNYKHALPEIYYPAKNGTIYQNCGIDDRNCANAVAASKWGFNDHCWYADINPCSCSASSTAIFEDSVPIVV